MDHVAAKAKPEPINARNTTRSRVATFVRNFSTLAATFPLPLFRLTSLRVCAEGKNASVLIAQVQFSNPGVDVFRRQRGVDRPPFLEHGVSLV